MRGTWIIACVTSGSHAQLWTARLEPVQNSAEELGDIHLGHRGPSGWARRSRRMLLRQRRALRALGKLRAEWLATEGKNVYRFATDRALETLGGQPSGQLTFALISLGETKRQLTRELAKVQPLDATAMCGPVRRYAPR